MVGARRGQSIVPLEGVATGHPYQLPEGEAEKASGNADISIEKNSFEVAIPENSAECEPVEKRKQFSYPPLPKKWTISASEDTKTRTGISAAVGGSDLDARTHTRARERQARGRAARAEVQRHHTTLQRFKAWHQWETEHYSSLPAFLLGTIGYPRRPDCPTDAELEALAKFYFPPRWGLEVSIYDCGVDKFELTTTTLGDIERGIVIHVLI